MHAKRFMSLSPGRNYLPFFIRRIEMQHHRNMVLLADKITFKECKINEYVVGWILMPFGCNIKSYSTFTLNPLGLTPFDLSFSFVFSKSLVILAV
jgi:hypothetical protein